MSQIDRLLGIMQRLRDPENGCPWDKEQTLHNAEQEIGRAHV